MESHLVDSITTCRCGHVLEKHGPDGCTVTDCACRQVRDEALEAEVQAVDEL